MAMAVHPDGKTIATGEIGPKPLISVWDVSTMEATARFVAPLKKGIAHLAFSPSGKFLAASAMDEDHNVAIFEWQKSASKKKGGKSGGPLVAAGKGTRANILSLCFNPDESQVVACAVKEVTFLSFAGGVIKGKRGIGWGKGGDRQAVLCGVFMGNTLLTGVFSGHIYVWKGNSISSKKKAHEKGCNALWARKCAPGFISGGNDGKVIVWTETFEKQKVLDLRDPVVNSYTPKVRSVCENEKGNKILVGTRGGEIVEFTDKKSQIHLRSHSDGELWGLAMHPTEQQFYTVGQEAMLAIWDIKTRRQLKFARLDCPADCLEFSPNAKFLAIGY
jgi:microtubule-associated protein-like 6